MEIKNKLTATREEKGGRDWMKQGEGISQRTYIHNRHRQQCGDSLKEGALTFRDSMDGTGEYYAK